MGLDGVELAMSVEDRFGISIREDEAQRILTVGDLTELVLARIAARERSVCPTLHAFLSLRSHVRQFTFDAALRIRPHQRIAQVIPSERRRSFWEQIEQRTGVVLPALERPVWLKRLLAVTVVFFFALAMLPARIDAAILPLSLLGAVFFSLAVLVLTRPFCVVPPAKLATFGDAARKFAGATLAVAGPMAPDPTTWVPEVLREIIAECLGVDRNDVVPSARFVEDLGMG